AQSHADIGPMAIVMLPDGTVLASGGPTRGQLFHFGPDGGQAATPLASLPFPVFDMALDAHGRLWAATGGRVLARLDPATGAVLATFGDSITQSVVVDPATGRIYVSSGSGVETFDPDTGTFHHFSDVRVGNLAVAPDGTLWGAAWPGRDTVVRFDDKGKA